MPTAILLTPPNFQNFQRPFTDICFAKFFECAQNWNLLINFSVGQLLCCTISSNFKINLDPLVWLLKGKIHAAALSGDVYVLTETDAFSFSSSFQRQHKQKLLTNRFLKRSHWNQ